MKNGSNPLPEDRNAPHSFSIGEAPTAPPAPLRLFNPCAWERAALVEFPASPGEAIPGIVHLPGLGIFPARPQPWLGISVTVAPLPDEAGFILENGQLRAVFTRGGQLVSLHDKVNRNRAVVTPDAPGNQFVIYEDYPHDYDAWEVDAAHLETRELLPDAISAAPFADESGLRAGIEFTFRFGKSTFRERVTLHAHDRLLRFDCTADWRERHRFLKVEFPVSVRAPEASFEIQFGYVKRPTHFNTMQDIVRFESCAHKWFDLSQPDYGVALLNDCKYGAAVHGSTPRLSWFAVDTPHLVIDTVKKAEDSDALIVRLYEAHGTSGEATLATPFAITRCARVNLLEDEASPGWSDIAFHANPASDGQSRATFSYKPFEIISLKLE